MKGYLKSGDQLLPLSPKVTTVGRDGCDIVIQSSSIDQQHAMLEYSDQDNGFILQDLNTSQGTYVNDVRVQNAAVRLAPGDIIRFGFGGVPYQLEIDTEQTPIAPAVQHRTAWSQPLTVMDPAPQPSYVQQSNSSGLPMLSTAPVYAQSSSIWTQSQGVGQQYIQQPQQLWQQQTVPSPHTSLAPSQLPHPPTLRSRPASAGNIRRTSYDRLGAIQQQQQQHLQQQQQVQPPQFSLMPQTNVSSQNSLVRGSSNGMFSNSWVNGPSSLTYRLPNSKPSASVMVEPDFINIQEKEQKIIELSEEVGRLRNIELELSRRDHAMHQLQQRLEEAQLQLSQHPSSIVGHDSDITNKLLQLETALRCKTTEITALNDQISRMKSDTQSQASLRQELVEKLSELNELRHELEKIRKDKNITSGLVTQMQRDMSNKDITISKLTREIEALRRDMREKDIQLSAVSTKIGRLKDNQKAEEERDAREKELISLRHKFKSTESKIQEQCDIIETLKQELEKSHLSEFEEKDKQKSLQSEVDQIKAHLSDLERAERLVRVDLEQVSNKFERFRGRMLQLAFATPGISPPSDKEITDDELMELLRGVIDERSDLRTKIEELEGQLNSLDSVKATEQEKVDQFKQRVQESVDRLKENGRLGRNLKQEVDLLQADIVDESLDWIKENLLALLNNELSWQQDLEAELEKCGAHVKLSNDSPCQHLQSLYARWESALTDKERVELQLSSVKEHHRAELNAQRERMREETTERVADAVERTKLEGDQKMKQAIEDLKAAELEKREGLFDDETKKKEELEAVIEQLRQSIATRQGEDEAQLSQANQALQEVDSYKELEGLLREQIKVLEDNKASELEIFKDEFKMERRRKDEEIASYKEQVKQHSVTICALEEKEQKASKKHQHHREEVNQLKKTIQDLRQQKQPSPPPAPAPSQKPKVILPRPTEELAALEQVIMTLRQENLLLKKDIKEQHDMVLSLRRDLSGASARLSDITGELSDQQKLEIEQNRDLVSRRDKELTELRQQMVELSRIIDQQKDEINTLETDLSKERSVSLKYRSTAEEHGGRIHSLEMRLQDEKDQQTRQISSMETEGRITAELSSIGAQCRGERHDQIISRQRDALAELRSRVKSLETNGLPVPTHDQALQQVVILKKELADMRACQALTQPPALQNATSLDVQVNRARGLIPEPSAEVDLEKSAHRETLAALEDSEKSYISLMRVISGCLEIEKVQGLISMAYLPMEERSRLSREREEMRDILIARIRALRDRIGRKDDLLEGYEGDLAKLRALEDVSANKTKHLEALTDELHKKSEEAAYLREALNRSKNRMQQEIRLNTAIKQKKTFHLENEYSHLAHSPKPHRCVTDDVMGKMTARKKAQSELLRRKNYEINTLKDGLLRKEREVETKDRRLQSLEASLVLEQPKEVLAG